MLVVPRDGSQVRYDCLKSLRCAVPGAVEVMLPMLPASLQRGHGAHMEARICGLIMRNLRETRLIRSEERDVQDAQDSRLAEGSLVSELHPVATH